MNSSHTYCGVYKSFSEVPAATSYNNDDNLASMEAFCRLYLGHVFAEAGLESNFVPPTGRTQYTDHIGLLVSLLLEREGEIRILDLGGGFGQSFLELCAMIGKDYKKVNYYCYDLEGTIDYATHEGSAIAKYALGSPIENNLRLVSDYSKIKDEVQNFDIVFVSAALHYFDNKYEVLADVFSHYSPKYVLISRTTVVLDTASFVSVQQNVPPLKIPMWFMNHNEILKFFKVRNYVLKFKSSIYNEDRPIAENLPAQCHNGRLAYYLFSRHDK